MGNNKLENKNIKTGLDALIVSKILRILTRRGKRIRVSRKEFRRLLSLYHFNRDESKLVLKELMELGFVYKTSKFFIYIDAQGECNGWLRFAPIHNPKNNRNSWW